MEGFLAQMSTSDTKRKVSLGQEMITFLGQAEPGDVTHSPELGAVIDALVPWVQSSNYKVCQNGLDIVGLLVERMGHSFRSYLGTVLVPTLDRLGDARESVREKAHNGLKLFMREVVDPQTLFDKLSTGFTHKNAKVREEVLFLVQDTLNEHGAHSLVISKMMHQIVNLASDPAAPVRDAAMTTLVEIYRHVGERVQSDLERKFQLPQAKLAVLLSKFDELRKSGEVVESPPLPDNQRGKDETDLVQSKSLTSKARSSSVPAGVRRPGSFAVPKAPTAGAGGLDEDSFTKSFEEVKHVNIFSGRALSEEIAKIKETLSKSSNDWKSRVDALQMVRSLMLAGALNFDEMHNSLRTLDVPFQVSIKDLRSQVVREACITVAYLSQQMGHKVDRLLEILFQNIINLIPNSAKVMSSSGIICIRFIIQNTFSSRFVPIITCNVTSKSRDIRRHCCEFLDLILHSWPTQSLEKHAHLIQEAIKKGIADADPEARQFARKAYWGFADHFKDQADQLLTTLDFSYRRLLQAGDISNSSSSNSLNMAGKATSTIPRSRQTSVANSRENISESTDGRRANTLTRKSSGIPQYALTSPIKIASTPPMFSQESSPSLRSTPMTARSNSAIDASAVRRANVRAQYAQRSRMGAMSGTLGSRSRRSSMEKTHNTPGGFNSPDVTNGTFSRNGRNRSRIGIVHSQPGSRSTSPSSLRAYQTYFDSPPARVVPDKRRSSNGIPGSSTSSREPSPGRGVSSIKKRTVGKSERFSPGPPSVTKSRPPKQPLMTENILRQSREAETALAYALNSQAERRKPAASFPFEDASDESEVSSVSSIGQSGHSPMKPRHIQSTNSLKGSNYSRPLANNNSRANTHLDPVNDSENLNPEDVHKNLRFTASAIQNYSFDSPGDLSDGSKFNLVNNAAPTLEEKMRMLDSRVSSVEESQSGNSIISTDPTRANLEMEDIMEILQSVKSGTKAAERRTCMTHLIRLTREGTVKQIQDNFRTILRLLLENLLDDVGATRALVYGVLTEMLKHEALSQSFQAFTELIILKVLEAHRDQEKDVERAAEGCAAAMAFILPSDIVIRVLNPIIKTGDFPVNQAAVKMLTKVADHQKSYDSIVANLSDIMPGLLKAYDNVESSVRKAAVFCMVSLHQRVGDELQPHLECLNGSKLKLLNLYIKRAQSQKEQSMPSSPRLQTPM
ncbi:CLIP-associating protein 1-like isoform X2 [Tigriopus californicus]|uniref:CLIP-associating protein 1-like isoform X2 n=1 Tax=Tigriopus californicus TaxID=6832 RepID=UPI0027DA473A|nr:CLIP-associating protein 1-like isoform X2 [Tigriopus californicus]